jgi:diguanylate cyclase (GGDEF)-like protein/PAS domain S-box-containing protein
MLHSATQRASGLAETELVDARSNDQIEFEGWRVRKNGNHFRASVLIKTIRDENGTITGYVKVVRDLAADQRRVQPVFFDLLEAAPDAMVIIGPDGRITMGNAQTDRMFGYSREELVGSHLEMLLPERFRKDHVQHRSGYYADPLLRPMGRGLELFGLRRDGTEFPVDISLGPLNIESTLYVSASIRDVTERRAKEDEFRRQHAELVEAKQELERLARLDTLTGLVNHAETITRLESALQNRRNPGQHLGVLFCDTDNFKAINDTMGHNVGDLVLSTIAWRIRDCVREGDTVGRIGGDEMLVLLPGVHSVEEVVAIGNKIRCRVAEPIDHEGKEIRATISVGATLAFPGESVSAMTTRADAAMYMAKRAGRNTVKSV